jgi:hypothetical protein
MHIGLDIDRFSRALARHNKAFAAGELAHEHT